MQVKLSNQQIRDKLAYIKSKLPNKPTAVNTLYSLPPQLANDVIRSNYSQSSLQKISDHIGYYLGLLKSVKINFIGIWDFTDDQWIGTDSGVFVGKGTGARLSGLYRSVGHDHSEILLIKKAKYEFKHVIAILAHEYAHNYLCHHRVREPREIDQEILTDLSVAYLGLGHLLIPGYEPITWTSDHWNYIYASGHTTHTLTIGYLTPGTIRRAVVIAAELRDWNPKEVTASFRGLSDKFKAYFQIRPYIKRLGLRVIVWVILYLLEHTGEDFQSEILLVAQTVSPSLDHPNLVVQPFDKA